MNQCHEPHRSSSEPGSVLHEQDALAGFVATADAWLALRRAAGGAQRNVDALHVFLFAGLGAAILVLGRLDPLHGLGLFVTAATALRVIGGLLAGSAQFGLQGGSAPRYLHVQGDWLVVQVGHAQRWYDMRLARVCRRGEWAMLRDPRARWLPDLVPCSLLDEATGRHVVDRPAATITSSGGVPVQATWRDTPARILGALATTSPWMGPGLLAVLGLTAAVTLREQLAPFALAALSGWTAGFAVWMVVQALAPLFDISRGVRIVARDHGICAHDEGYVEVAAWAGAPVKRITEGSLVLVRPVHCHLQRRDAGDAAFDALLERIRRHAVPRHGSARPGAGLRLAIVQQVALCSLLVTMAVRDGVPNLDSRRPIDMVFIAAGAYFVLLPLLVGVMRTIVVRRPAPTPVPHRGTTTRGRACAAAAALLLLPGSLVLATVAPAYLRADVAVWALVGAAAGAALLVIARDADGVGITDRLLAVAVGASTCGALLLFDAWQVTLAADLVGPVLALSAGAAALVVVSSTRSRSARPRTMRAGAALGATPLAVGLSLVAAGATIHELRAASQVDIAAPQVALRSGLVSEITIDGTPIERAWAQSYRVAVSWDGDRATVTPEDGAAGAPFGGAAGRRAVERLEASLDLAASQPGPRPALRRLVLARSASAARVHAAFAGVSAATTRPAYLVRALDDSRVGAPTSNARAGRQSHYHERSELIILGPTATTGLVELLRAPRGATASSRSHTAFGTFLHELEHAMTSHRDDPRWITEAVAEVVPSWAGVSTAHAIAMQVKLPKERFPYSREYDEWAGTLHSILFACGHESWEPRTAPAVMRTLRTGDGSITDALARCLRTSGASSLDRTRLTDRLLHAHDHNGAAELLDELEYPD